MRTLSISPSPFDDYNDGQKVLRVEYYEGSLTPSRSNTDLPPGGNVFYAVPLNKTFWEQSNGIEFCYDVFFENGFNFNLGGKLPGLYGGAASSCKTAPDCFSTRLMWRTSGMGELYPSFDRNQQVGDYCSVMPFSRCIGGYGDSLGRGAWTFKTGEWTKVCQRTRLNTPNQKDGSVQGM
jgi:hypothetical protein